VRGSLAASLAPILAAAIAGLACAPRPALPPAIASRPPTPARTATWVWDEATVVSAPARQDLLAFARAKDVGTLFVHAAPGFDGERGFEGLAALVEAASRQGAAVTLVGGDPAWSQPAHFTEALAFVHRAARLEAQLIARGLPRNNRVLFDVEPYLRPEWRASPERARADYLALLRTVRAAAREEGLEAWHTIPFWFSTDAVAGASLDGLVLEESAGVVVMAYRNRTADVRSLAAPLLERGARRGKPIIVAIETTCVDPPYVTFCGRTGLELADALDELARDFGQAPAFSGLAVHMYASWATIASSMTPSAESR
jgi:hypothetical protein